MGIDTSIEIQVKTASGDIFNRMMIASYSTDFMKAVITDLQKRVDGFSQSQPSAVISGSEEKPKTKFSDWSTGNIKDHFVLSTSRLQTCSKLKAVGEAKRKSILSMMEDSYFGVRTGLEVTLKEVNAAIKESDDQMMNAKRDLHELFGEMARRVNG